MTTPHPLEGFTDSMLPSEGPSQERRRLNVSAETADRVSQVMQDPPTYVVISIEITLFMIGGDAEAVGALIEGTSRERQHVRVLRAEDYRHAWTSEVRNRSLDSEVSWWKQLYRQRPEHVPHLRPTQGSQDLRRVPG
ncbi:hypothetical protein ENSA7_35220 [Enhygromyxa salina]|uniref:Uncharacterized protein n=1 Tax=Enhygromyxa salina TaxID=215803 RepID=A0A2S9YNI1_9BACT|nr:hypothetical protein [Enhygromyxa salina]PRQ06646.1 hypothetical protein ENSA7_35220 [Enhygromyxa salina]